MGLSPPWSVSPFSPTWVGRPFTLANARRSRNGTGEGGAGAEAAKAASPLRHSTKCSILPPSRIPQHGSPLQLPRRAHPPFIIVPTVGIFPSASCGERRGGIRKSSSLCETGQIGHQPEKEK